MRAGICTTKTTQITIKGDQHWLKRLRVRGVVVGRTIYFAEPLATVPEFVFRHELEHCYQQVRDGRVFFYLKYFLYSVRYGYQKNPYEVEAVAAALLPLTPTEEQLLWKLREDSPQ